MSQLPVTLLYSLNGGPAQSYGNGLPLGSLMHPANAGWAGASSPEAQFFRHGMLGPYAGSTSPPIGAGSGGGEEQQTQDGPVQGPPRPNVTPYGGTWDQAGQDNAARRSTYDWNPNPYGPDTWAGQNLGPMVASLPSPYNKQFHQDAHQATGDQMGLQEKQPDMLYPTPKGYRTADANGGMIPDFMMPGYRDPAGQLTQHDIDQMRQVFQEHHPDVVLPRDFYADEGMPYADPENTGTYQVPSQMPAQNDPGARYGYDPAAYADNNYGQGWGNGYDGEY